MRYAARGRPPVSFVAPGVARRLAAGVPLDAASSGQTGSALRATLAPMNAPLGPRRASMALLLLPVACGSQATPSTGPAQTCTLPKGAYVEHFTAQATQGLGTSCPPLADAVVVFDGTTSFDPGGSTGTALAGGADAGVSCSSDVSASSCALSATCTQTTGTAATGLTVAMVSATVTVRGATGTGEQTVSVEGPAGSTQCSYAITLAPAGASLDAGMTDAGGGGD